MDSEVSGERESTTNGRSWEELQEILKVAHDEDGERDDALRSYLDFAISLDRADRYAEEPPIERCTEEFIQSPLFQSAKEYVRIQLLASFFEEGKEVVDTEKARRKAAGVDDERRRLREEQEDGASHGADQDGDMNGDGEEPEPASPVTKSKRRQSLNLTDNVHETSRVISAFLLSDSKMEDATPQLIVENGWFLSLVEWTCYDTHQSFRSGLLCLLYESLRQQNAAFRLILEYGWFSQLLEWVLYDADDSLRYSYLDLLYEILLDFNLRDKDLISIEDHVKTCLEVVEDLPDDTSDPSSNTLFRFLLVLNHQYLSALETSTRALDGEFENVILQRFSTEEGQRNSLSLKLVWFFNVEGDTSRQKLVLQMFYMIFTTPNTYEYVLSNDLDVLIGVLIRKLLDMDDEAPGAMELKHFYLRVMHPLLANTGIEEECNVYKREQLRRLFVVLYGPEESSTEDGMILSSHFAPADDQTKALVTKCREIEWLRDKDAEQADKPAQTPTKQELVVEVIPNGTPIIMVNPEVEENGVKSPVESNGEVKLIDAANGDTPSTPVEEQHGENKTFEVPSSMGETNTNIEPATTSNDEADSKPAVIVSPIEDDDSTNKSEIPERGRGFLKASPPAPSSIHHHRPRRNHDTTPKPVSYSHKEKPLPPLPPIMIQPPRRHSETPLSKTTSSSSTEGAESSASRKAKPPPPPAARRSRVPNRSRTPDPARVGLPQPPPPRSSSIQHSNPPIPLMAVPSSLGMKPTSATNLTAMGRRTPTPVLKVAGQQPHPLGDRSPFSASEDEDD